LCSACTVVDDTRKITQEGAPLQVDITRIVFPAERAREVDDELFVKLQESLKNDGLQVPLLVDENYRIIDGRTRGLAALGLGWETIEVEVATTYEVMMVNLTKANAEASIKTQLTPRRIWEIYKDSIGLMKARMDRLKRMNFAEKKRYAKVSPIGHNPLPTALGVGPNTVQAVRTLYRIAEEDAGALGNFCRGEVAKIDAGETSVNSALTRFHDQGRRITGSTDIKIQRNVLEKVLIHLKSIDSALATLGPLSPEATARDIDEWLHALYESNTTLYRLRAALRKERESR
jgi:hypothetical protein